MEFHACVAERLSIPIFHISATHTRMGLRNISVIRNCRLYLIIAVENLDLSALKRALKFGKSVLDNGWGMFVKMLQYKAGRKGKYLVKVNRWFPSSKTCISCGHIHKELSLSDRTYVCPICGHVMDRDHQAAKNILKEAWRMLEQPAPCA